MSQWGCDMLLSGVPTGRAGQLVTAPGTCSNAVNSPGAARSPCALLWGVVGYMGSDQIPPAVGCPANVGSRVSAKEGLSTPGTAAYGKVSFPHRAVHHHEASGDFTSTPPGLSQPMDLRHQQG